MTKKEVEIQRALGTLPLWLRIKHGDVKLIDASVKWRGKAVGLMLLTCRELPRHHYYYRENDDGARKRAILCLVRDCKRNGWEG